MRKVKREKKKKVQETHSVVLVSSFHSDEEEPWTYSNRAPDRFLGHPMLDIRSAIAVHAPMRGIC